MLPTQYRHVGRSEQHPRAGLVPPAGGDVKAGTSQTRESFSHVLRLPPEEFHTMAASRSLQKGLRPFDEHRTARRIAYRPTVAPIQLFLDKNVADPLGGSEPSWTGGCKDVNRILSRPWRKTLVSSSVRRYFQTLLATSIVCKCN